MRRFTIITALMGLLALAVAAAAPIINGEVMLSLQGAVTQVEKATPTRSEPRALLMNLACINGTWLPRAQLDYSQFISSRPATVPLAADGNRLSFTFTVADDTWTKGGTGALTLEMAADGDKASGTFRGTWNGQPVDGKISGTVFPFWGDLAPQLNFTAGQHPRLLGISIAELKRRASTDWGKRYVNVVRDFLSKPQDLGRDPYREEHRAIGYALLWLLEGKPEDLQRAKFWMYWCMNDRSGEAGAWCNGPRIAGVAYCFDLLYDQLTADEKADILRCLTEDPRLAGFTTPPDRFTGSYPLGFASAALCCRLAILGEPTEAPQVTPAKDATRIAPLPADMAQPANAPVTTLAHWRCPETWLRYGIFPGSDAMAIIKDLGGLAGPVPAAGTTFTSGGVQHALQLLGKDQTRQVFRFYPRGANPCLLTQGVVDQLPVQNRYQPAWTIFTTLVDTDERTMYAQPDYESATYGVRLWVNDVEVKRDQVIHFAKGRYRLTCAAPLSGAQWVAPNFRDYDEAAAQAAAADRAALIAANQGTLPGQARALLELRNWLAADLPGFVGDQGAMAAVHGRNDAWHLLMPVMHSWHVATKLPPISEGIDRSYDWYLHSRGLVFGLDWGKAMWASLGFPDSVAPEYRALQRQTLDAYGADAIAYGSVGQALWLLLNCPVDTPADQAVISKLPKVLHDTRMGAYSLRTGWDLTTSLAALVQVQTRADYDGQYAGTWAVGGMHPMPNNLFLGGIPTPGGVFTIFKPIDRAGGTVPRIEGCVARGGGKVLSEASPPDGSLILSMETGDYVADPGESSKAYIAATPTGAKVVRHLAFDLSGISGAPMVIVQLDRFSNIDVTPHWVGVPFGRGQGALDGKTYRWTGTDDGNPRPAHVTWTPITGSLVTAPDLRHQGGDDLWSVFVISQDEPPVVKIEGEGLNAVVTIGKRTIRFDGEKLVLAQ